MNCIAYSMLCATCFDLVYIHLSTRLNSPGKTRKIDTNSHWKMHVERSWKVSGKRSQCPVCIL